MGAGQHDGVAVRITQPAFKMGVLAAMAWLDYLGVEFPCPHHGTVEVVEFKPQKHTVPVRPKVCVPNESVLVLHIPSVQLKNQPVLRNKPLILATAMPALTAQEVLVPATACINVLNADEGM